MSIKMDKGFIIWSNRYLDYEKDWKADLEEQYPNLTDDERRRLMYEINDEYLEDERQNLNIQYGQPILVIADIGRWDGRAYAALEIKSGNISDCLRAIGRDEEYLTWYVDTIGDLKCKAVHHDNVNYYTYRVYRPELTVPQRELLRLKIFQQMVDRKELTRKTLRLGDEIANVYGWKVHGMKGFKKKNGEEQEII